MRNHSSETSENTANVNSQKSHCFCLALALRRSPETPLMPSLMGWWFCPTSLKDNFAGVSYTAYTNTKSWNIRPMLVLSSKHLYMRTGETSKVIPKAYTVLHSTARIHVYWCKYLFASPGFLLRWITLVVRRPPVCRRWWTPQRTQCCEVVLCQRLQQQSTKEKLAESCITELRASTFQQIPPLTASWS